MAMWSRGAWEFCAKPVAATGMEKYCMPCCVNPRTRTGGYDCPTDPLQLTSWILIVLFAVTFFGLWVPQLDSAAEQAVASAVYGAVTMRRPESRWWHSGSILAHARFVRVCVA